MKKKVLKTALGILTLILAWGSLSSAMAQEGKSETGKWHLTFTGLRSPALATSQYKSFFGGSGYYGNCYGSIEYDGWEGYHEHISCENVRQEGSPLRGGVRLSRNIQRSTTLGIGVTQSGTQEIEGVKYEGDEVPALPIQVLYGVKEKHKIQTIYAFGVLKGSPKKGFFRKNYVQLGLGIGYNRIWSELKVAKKKVDTSHGTVGILPFLEIGRFVGRNVSIGMTIEKNFLRSRRIESFQYEYYQNDEKVRRTFPAHEVNFGSFGIGLHAGFHF